MRKAIEFINNTGVAPDPIQKTKEVAFREIVFKEQYRTRKARFTQSLTWLRFLPAIKPSMYDWMMAIDVHRDINGVTFTSPKTLDSNHQSCFDIARIWFQKNNSLLLSSREKNPNGYKLYPMRFGVSWVVEEQAPEGEKLKLLLASLYNGERGGTTGLAYNIRKEADARDNEPNSKSAGQLIHGDITNPTAGRLVKVEKIAGGEYASYKAGIGKNPAPIDHFLAQLTDEEMNLLCPLEKTLYIPTEQEQHELLRRYIGEKHYQDIFGNHSFATSWEKEKANEEEENKEYLPSKSTTRTPADKTEEVEEVEERQEVGQVKETEKTPTQKSDQNKPNQEKNLTTSEETEEEPNEKPYTTREVTSLLGQEKEGVQILLKNKHRLSKTHMEIVLAAAEELDLA
jgi:hypothetical protein